jgi:hypothetical protein
VNPNKAFSTSLISVSAVASFFVLMVLLFIKPISSNLGYALHPEYIQIMAVVVALDAIQSIIFARIRYENKAMKFASLKLSFIILNIGLNLFIFLVAPRLLQNHPSMMGWYNPDYQVGYIFIINLICTAVITFGLIPEIKMVKYGFDTAMMKQMLRYTWPLLLLGLAGILNQVADKIIYRIIVPGQEGEVQLGIYGACVKIAMIMALITQAFRYAYEPFVFGANKNSDSKEVQAKVMKYFIMVTLFAFLTVMLYMDIFKHFVNSGYWAGLKVIPVVMMAEIFMGVYFNLSFWYKLIDETYWGAVFSGIGCVVLIAINFIFVPKYGYMASAWGGFAGYGVCMLLSYIVGRKRCRLKYDLKGISGYFILAMALCIINNKIHIENRILQLVVSTILLMIYVAVMAYNERLTIKDILSSLKLKFLKRKQ